jgi:hypothetical protein
MDEEFGIVVVAFAVSYLWGHNRAITLNGIRADSWSDVSLRM